MESRDNKKSIGIKPILIVSAIGIAGFAIIKLLRNLLHNPTSDINQSTEDFNHSKQQAANLFAWFGVVRVNGVAVSTPVVKQNTLNRIAWLAVNIDNWAVVQSTFTSLCGGNYTVLEAAKTALSVNNFGVFSNYISNALTKKIIVCNVENGITLKNANRYGGVAAEQFVKNDFVGRCQSTDADYYYYISEKDGNTYAAPIREFKLV